MSDPLGYCAKGAALHEKGDYLAALDYFGEAIRLDPQLGEAYAQRGLVWHDLGNYEAALADYDAAIHFYPSARTYEQRALTRQVIGDLPGAISDYEQALARCDDPIQIEIMHEILLALRLMLE